MLSLYLSSLLASRRSNRPAFDFLNRIPIGVAAMTPVLDDEGEMSFKHDHTLVGLVLGAWLLLAEEPVSPKVACGFYTTDRHGDTG
jgi:hypothetical protein